MKRKGAKKRGRHDVDIVAPKRKGAPHVSPPAQSPSPAAPQETPPPRSPGETRTYFKRSGQPASVLKVKVVAPRAGGQSISSELIALQFASPRQREAFISELPTMLVEGGIEGRVSSPLGRFGGVSTTRNVRVVPTSKWRATIPIVEVADATKTKLAARARREKPRKKVGQNLSFVYVEVRRVHEMKKVVEVIGHPLKKKG